MSPPSSQLNSKPSKKSVRRRHKQACCLLHAGFLPGLETEVTCSSEMSVEVQRAPRHYNPEDKILYNHRSKSLKSDIKLSSHFGLQVTAKSRPRHSSSG
jgi:hypothetical protein